VVVVSGIAYLLYYFSQSDSVYKDQSALNAISAKSPLFFKINNPDRFLDLFRGGNAMINELENIGSFQNLSALIQTTDSLLQNNSGINFKPDELDIWITTESTAKEEYNHAIVIAFPTLSKIMGAIETLKSELHKSYDVSEGKYDGKKVYKTVYNSGKNEFWFAAHKGILILSYHQFMLESCLRQLDEESELIKNPEFSYISSTAGRNALINFYLNHNSINQVLGHYTSAESRNKLLKAGNYGQWSELDLMIKNEEVYLNGFSVSDKTMNDYIHIFSNTKGGSHNLAEIIPSSASGFLSFSIDEVETLMSNLDEHRDRNGKSKEYSTRFEAMKRASGADPQKLFGNIIHSNFALVLNRNGGKELAGNSFFIADAGSVSESQTLILNYLKAYSERNPDHPLKETTSKIDDATSFKIYKFPHPDIFQTLFGDLFSSLEINAFTFYNNYLICGFSEEVLTDYVKEIFRKNTLKNDLDFKEFSANITAKSNLNFYLKPAASGWILKEIIGEDFIKDFTDHIGTVEKFKALSFQLGVSKKPYMISSDLFIQYDPVVAYKPQTVWELGFDTTLRLKPQLVRNHQNNQKEIFVQDDNNKIFLINYAGRILWEKQLESPILGEVHQIDYYKNNKLQYLFNTELKLYLLDRNGNHVERYPVAMNSPATAGIGIADYDKNRDYRIFVPCSDNKVYLYAQDGNVVDGWKFRKSESAVTQPVQHVRSKTKDYIVFIDQNRPYILNRKGKDRVDVDASFTPSSKNQIVFDKSSLQFVASDINGNIWFINTNGKTSSVTIKTYSADHYFLFEDLNGDGSKDYIFVDNQKVEAFNQQKKMVCSFTLEESITEAPVYYEFPGNQKKLGLVAGKSNTIYLINEDGSLYDGFPLFGHTKYSIGSISGGSRFNLFVGTDDNFLYNYNVK